VIEVLAPGLFTTVQDLGREGFGPMGVSASGAADPVALRLGNALLQNAPGSAALEMTLLGGTFRFTDSAFLALTGSDFGATLDGQEIPCWKSFEAKCGATLRVGTTRSGARCYLCVAGGIEVRLFLGSASTHILSGLGGLDGRALKKGDVLATGARSVDHRPRMIAKSVLERLAPRKILRVTPGPQAEWFDQSAREAFHFNPWTVSEESNRMGLRLEGTPIPTPAGGQMITEGISLGAIQVPHGGQPIILFVEQQTTGGYPKIANIISADLASVGQLRPRDQIRFEPAGFDTARRLLQDQEDLLRSEEELIA